jgi:hypothetical protein
MSWNPLDLLSIGKSIIDKVIPDASKRAELKLELERLHQQGELKTLEVRMSAILEEARSKDKWTSRARPSFLYVMYIMILSALPMGVLYAISPETAGNIATGLKEWLHAIPDSLYALFGAGYLGYSGARSYDKKKRLEIK